MSILNGKSVLVIEDDEMLREIIADTFRHEKSIVHVAEGANPGIAILQRETVDAVVSDVMMADGDGFELLLWLQDFKKQNPVTVMISGFSQMSKKKALELGAVDLLNKPFKQTDLLRVVKDELLKKKK